MKGVPNKNIKELDGQPLIAYSILDSLRTPLIEETYVTTDSPKIAKIAKKYGAEVPFLRPKKYATSTSTDIGYAKHFVNWYYATKGELPLIVILKPTTPIREVDILNNAITSFLNSKATSLRAVEEFDESPYKWFDIKDGYLVPLLNDNWDMHSMPRQLVPKVYRPNGYIEICRSEFIRENDLCGKLILPYITPVSKEIDTELDFKIVQFLLQNLPS